MGIKPAAVSAPQCLQEVGGLSFLKAAGPKKSQTDIEIRVT